MGGMPDADDTDDTEPDLPDDESIPTLDVAAGTAACPCNSTGGLSLTDRLRGLPKKPESLLPAPSLPLRILAPDDDGTAPVGEEGPDVEGMRTTLIRSDDLADPRSANSPASGAMESPALRRTLSLNDPCASAWGDPKDDADGMGLLILSLLGSMFLLDG